MCLSLVCWIFFLPMMVDADVVRFVYMRTKNRWLYRDNTYRRWLFIFDRIIDCISIVVFITYIAILTLCWYVYVCLYIYIIVRFISFVLFSNKIACKYYTLPTIVCSIFCITAVSIPAIQQGERGLFYFIFSFCAMYMFPIIWTFPQLKFVDDDLTQFLPKLKSNFWFIWYHSLGTRLILVDRYFDIIAIIQFVCYIQASFYFQCLLVLFGYSTLRLISIALYYNTNMCKCYAVRTVVPWIISGFNL